MSETTRAREDFKRQSELKILALQRNPEYIKDFTQWARINQRIINDDDLNYFSLFQDQRGNIYKTGKGVKSLTGPGAKLKRVRCLTAEEKQLLRKERDRLQGHILDKYRLLFPVSPQNPQFASFVYFPTVLPVSADKNILSIQIDLSRNPDLISEEIRELIKAKQQEKPELSTDKEYNFRNGERIFQVYDLKEQGLSFKDIVLRLLSLYSSGKDKQTLDHLIDSAKKDYAAAKELIGRNIKKPEEKVTIEPAHPCANCPIPIVRCKEEQKKVPACGGRWEEYLANFEVKQNAVLAGVIQEDPEIIKTANQRKGNIVAKEKFKKEALEDPDQLAIATRYKGIKPLSEEEKRKLEEYTRGNRVA